MEKQKRWQFYVILAVILLTLYNILPTVFYYAQPLKEPINIERSKVVGEGIVQRINGLETSAEEWLASFSKLLGIHPTEIAISEKNPRFINITFKNEKDARLFRQFLPQAGSSIAFVPEQLSLKPDEADSTKVTVTRNINVHLSPQESNQLFTFSELRNKDGSISEIYRNYVYGRATELALAFGGNSRAALELISAIKNPSETVSEEALIALSRNIVDFTTTFTSAPQLVKRFYASITQSSSFSNEEADKFAAQLKSLKTKMQASAETLRQEQKDLVAKGMTLDPESKLKLNLIENQNAVLSSALAIVEKNKEQFLGVKPLEAETIAKTLKSSASELKAGENTQIISLQGKNPFVEALAIDWTAGKISLQFYEDVQKLRLFEGKTESLAYSRDKLNQYLINDIAQAAQRADEQIQPSDTTFAVVLNNLTDTQSILAMNLDHLSRLQVNAIERELKDGWQPRHPDLARELFPIYSYDAYKALKPSEQKLGLVVYAPVAEEGALLDGMRPGSIYVIAKGLDAILEKYKEMPNAPDASLIMSDIDDLNKLLQQEGFIGYSGQSYGVSEQFQKDYLFELSDYYSTFIDASREAFQVKGDKRLAVLDFTNVEQRILAWNRIEDRVQEDLLKWKDAYHAAQVDLDATNHYVIPAPTKNVYWENLKLSFKKYFYGDERKILKWGLDLSGGKTVRIGLRDHNNRPVTNPEDLNQAVNELYDRINKMGVAERTIHVENNNIILDFPGSQALSAQELIKASAMYFHIVNEKFTPNNALLREAVHQFLQNVWNEAVVTNRKDVESINEIAWEHLGGDSDLGEFSRPRSEVASILYENGLRLANPKTAPMTSDYNDTLSSVGVMRGDAQSAWEGERNPLVILFHNFALEGANLANVNAGYDPSQGNMLSFGVKSSYDGQNQGNPQDGLYAWTSQFAQDKISGTPKEAYSQGRGWRMAVILNGAIISTPTLQAALKEGGSITGRFSQREVNQLAADLKAGSLSFTPKILSEQNVSPELGAEERMKGAIASFVALLLVVASMVGYYHFAGVVASCAVLFNILIMWGVLQNLGAALSLPTIAGIVLTIGMAIDANVLVFERIREEFSVTGRIASAIQAGYRKAFSAIVDSNITTIIAALILIQFDSGPIKGFAVALIVGIISSMFTALFMTRYYFAGWVQNPKNRSLKMSQFFTLTHFDFLSQTRKAVIISLVLMIAGSYLFISERKTIFGMDFTGGYALTLEVAPQEGNPNYRLEAYDALLAAGATPSDIQVRELSHANQLRIQLGMGIEEKNQPFFSMPESTAAAIGALAYQENPRLAWVVSALEKGGLTIAPRELEQLDKNWTVMSGQFSQAMRSNAIKGLALALLSILIYITLRFEFKYAVGAVVGLVHDVIITMGIFAAFHWLGFPVAIDLSVIGAIMTLVGYSLNDTIIVFDRIREDIKHLRKLSLTAVVNHALNVTLSRTVMTSGTTLLVLLALLFIGGQSIFAFSLVMTIGVFVGTLSSLYIASPVMIWYHNYEHRNDVSKTSNEFQKA